MKTTSALRAFLLGSALLSATWSAHAATATWDGGDVDWSGWHFPNNWSPNGVPTFNSQLDVIFSNNLRPANRIEYSRTIRSLTFTSAATVANEIRLLDTDSVGKPLTLGGSGQPASITNNGQGTKSIGNGAGTIVLGNNLTMTNNSSDSLRLMSPVSGAFSITKNGAGPVVMGVANSYSGGTVINAGTVTMSVADALGTTGAITFAGTTSTVVWGGTNTQNISSRIVMNNGAKAILNTGANNVIFASAIGSSSTAGLVKQGTGTLTLNAANTHSGATTVSAGILSLGNSLALQNSAYDTAGSVAGGTSAGLRTTVTTLTFGGLTGDKHLANVFTTTSGGYSGVTALTLNPGTGATPGYSGIIANGAAGMTLTKTGGGTQTLSGDNSYSGATIVTGGTLLINGQHTNGGLITVSSGATLGGNGTVGDLKIEAGFLAPGTSAGTLDVGALTLTSTSVLDFELGSPWVSGIPADSDYIAVGGNLILNGTLQVAHSVTPAYPDKWLLMTYTGELTNNGLTVTTAAPSAGSYAILTDTLNKQVFLAVVPEPASAGLLLIGGLALRALSRRRTLRCRAT